MDHTASTKLDLSNPNAFKDWSKPIGALDKKRLDYFLQRMEGICADNQDDSFDSANGDGGDNDGSSVIGNGYNPNAPFLYGTHYSAPGYVLYYLIRSMPEHMLWYVL